MSPIRLPHKSTHGADMGNTYGAADMGLLLWDSWGMMGRIHGERMGRRMGCMGSIVWEGMVLMVNAYGIPHGVSWFCVGAIWGDNMGVYGPSWAHLLSFLWSHMEHFVWEYVWDCNMVFFIVMYGLIYGRIWSTLYGSMYGIAIWCVLL